VIPSKLQRTTSLRTQYDKRAKLPPYRSTDDQDITVPASPRSQNAATVNDATVNDVTENDATSPNLDDTDGLITAVQGQLQRASTYQSDSDILTRICYQNSGSNENESPPPLPPSQVKLRQMAEKVARMQIFKENLLKKQNTIRELETDIVQQKSKQEEMQEELARMRQMKTEIEQQHIEYQKRFEKKKFKKKLHTEQK